MPDSERNYLGRCVLAVYRAWLRGLGEDANMAVVPFKTQTEEGVSVWDIARELLDIHNGNISAAADGLIERANRDQRLYDAILAMRFHRMCGDIIREALGTQRRTVWDRPVEQAKEMLLTRATERANERAILASEMMLMDFPIFGGGRLRNANKQQLIASAEQFEQRGEDMLAKARWLRAVAAQLKGKRTVGTTLTEDQLMTLKARAENA